METSRERWAELVLHPVRIRILRACGAPITARELAALLPDVPQATLYRQLATLVKAGLLDVVEERKVRGAVERVYAVSDRGATLDAEAMATATPEDHARYFTAFMSSLLSEFSRYLGRERLDFAADGVGYHQLVLHLTDEELAAFAGDLNALLRPLMANRPGNGRVARLLATVLLPVEQPDSPDGTRQAPQPADGSGTTEGKA